MSERQVVVATLGGIHQLSDLKELIDEVLKVYPEAFFGTASEGEYEDRYEYPVFYNLFDETEIDKRIDSLRDIVYEAGLKVQHFTNWRTAIKLDVPIPKNVLDEFYENYKGEGARLSSNGKILEVKLSEDEFNERLSVLQLEYDKVNSELEGLIDLQIEQDESRWLWGGEDSFPEM